LGVSYVVSVGVVAGFSAAVVDPDWKMPYNSSVLRMILSVVKRRASVFFPGNLCISFSKPQTQ